MFQSQGFSLYLLIKIYANWHLIFNISNILNYQIQIGALFKKINLIV
jgi:hypothetical protein